MSSEAGAVGETGDGRIVGAARKIEERVEAAKAKVDKARETIGEKLEGVKKKAKKGGKRALEKGGERLDDVSEYVKEHPVKSVCAALGAGLVLGLLLGRR